MCTMLSVRTRHLDKAPQGEDEPAPDHHRPLPKDAHAEAPYQARAVRAGALSLTGRKCPLHADRPQHITRKIYMLEGLEPSIALTGGPWYTDNELDTEFIQNLTEACYRLISDIVRLPSISCHRARPTDRP